VVKRILVVAFGIAAATLYYSSTRVPNVFSVPLDIPYSGEDIRSLPVKIEVEGTYEVEISVDQDPKNPGIIEPPMPKTGVVIAGKPVGKQEQGSSSSGERMGFVSYKFFAAAGDTALLSVRKTRSFEADIYKNPHLRVQRIPFEYLQYWINVWGRQLGAFLFAGAAFVILFVSLMSRRRAKASEAQEIHGEGR